MGLSRPKSEEPLSKLSCEWEVRGLLLIQYKLCWIVSCSQIRAVKCKLVLFTPASHVNGDWSASVLFSHLILQQYTLSSESSFTVSHLLPFKENRNGKKSRKWLLFLCLTLHQMTYFRPRSKFRVLETHIYLIVFLNYKNLFGKCENRWNLAKIFWSLRSEWSECDLQVSDNLPWVGANTEEIHLSQRRLRIWRILSFEKWLSKTIYNAGDHLRAPPPPALCDGSKHLCYENGPHAALSPRHDRQL